MASLQGASRAASSSSSPPWRYQVFLSFRGEDTRNNFTAHLNKALVQKGINTYMDNNLERGEEISTSLLEAIEGSEISIIILSPHYASSTWCLNEMVKILECKETKQQIVLPVFYHVDPSDVRHQRNTFEEAFAEHEGQFKEDKEKVQRWKAALTEVCNLSGFHLTKERNESEFINKIIQSVDKTITHTSKLAGIQYYAQWIRSIRMNDMLEVGIRWTGEIGKTLLAQAAWSLIGPKSQAVNVRKTSGEERGLVKGSQAVIIERDRGSSKNTGGSRNKFKEKGDLVKRQEICDHNGSQVKRKETYDHSGSQPVITKRDKGSSNNTRGDRDKFKGKSGLVKRQEAYDHSGSQALNTERGRESNRNTGGDQNKSRKNDCKIICFYCKRDGHIKQNCPKYKAEKEKSLKI